MYVDSTNKKTWNLKTYIFGTISSVMLQNPNLYKFYDYNTNPKSILYEKDFRIYIYI